MYDLLPYETYQSCLEVVRKKLPGQGEGMIVSRYSMSLDE